MVFRPIISFIVRIRRETERDLGWRHYLYQDLPGLGIPGGHTGSVQQRGGRLLGEQGGRHRAGKEGALKRPGQDWRWRQRNDLS